MVTFLVTSALVLGLIAIAIYFWQKPANTTETFELPPPPTSMRGLFADEQQSQLAPAAEDESPKQQELNASPSETNEVEVNQIDVEALLAAWRESPDRQSTAQMLHEVALFDDADTYRQAVETVLGLWRQKGIRDLSARDLQALLNGEFWILSSNTRASGAGFVLKQTLATAKRELERANNPNLSTTSG